MFTQDFVEDGKRFVESFYGDKPFALSRYGDGESAIINGGTHVAKSDGWAWKGHDTKLRDLLRESLEADLPGYCIGLANGADQPEDFDKLYRHVKAPVERLTFCELLMFANYKRYATSLKMDDCLTVGRGCDVETPHEPYSEEWDNWPAILDAMLETDKRAIVLCAGPWSCVLVHEYWKASGEKICVDLGSAVAVRFRKRNTRRYHHKESVGSLDNLGFWPNV